MKPVIGIISILVILFVWYGVTESGLVKPLYLPSPRRVVIAVSDLGSTILIHAAATIGRIIVGFLLGAFVGIGVGLLMSSNRYIYSALNGIIESWRPVPPVALIPFFILWFGFSDIGKIILVMLGVFLVLVVNTIESVRNVRPVYLRVGTNLGATKAELYKTVIVPAILPSLVSGLRIAMALSMSLVIVSEFMGADWGLGYLISISKVTFSTHTILLSIFVIGFICWFLDFILRKVMARLTRWAEKSSEALAIF